MSYEYEPYGGMSMEELIAAGIVDDPDNDEPMSNTNDQQAPYGVKIISTDPNTVQVNCGPMDKPTERAPLLSEVEVERMLDKHDFRDEMDAMKELWRFYESKITSGELRVVKKAYVVMPKTTKDFAYCSACKEPVDVANRIPPFFHTCGAQIVEG